MGGRAQWHLVHYQGGAVACIAPCHDFSSQNLEIRASVPDVERPDGVSTADDANVVRPDRVSSR